MDFHTICFSIDYDCGFKKFQTIDEEEISDLFKKL